MLKWGATGSAQAAGSSGRQRGGGGVQRHAVRLVPRGADGHLRDEKAASLHPKEIIRRFLLHVLPKGFSKIRHYGPLASANVKTKLSSSCRLLQAQHTARCPTF